MKLKSRHFDTVEVIEAEHNFQDAFKKWQKCWERCIHAEGDYFEV
jgi:hypothetical protein